MKKSRIALLAILAGMVCLFLCAACGSFSKQLSDDAGTDCGDEPVCLRNK